MSRVESVEEFASLQRDDWPKVTVDACRLGIAASGVDDESALDALRAVELRHADPGAATLMRSLAERLDEDAWSAQEAGFASLQRLTFDAPRDGEEEIAARELKVWAHKITPEGDSEGLPARVDVHLAQEIRHFDLALSRGQVTLPLPDGSCRVDITLARRS